jgi:hypothetical protein
MKRRNLRPQKVLYHWLLELAEVAVGDVVGPAHGPVVHRANFVAIFCKNFEDLKLGWLGNFALNITKPALW